LAYGGGGGGGGAAAPAGPLGGKKRGLGSEALSPAQKEALRTRMESGKKAKKERAAVAAQRRARSAPAMGRPKKDVAVPKAPDEVDHFAEKREALDDLLGNTGKGVAATLERSVAALSSYYLNERADRLPAMFTSLAAADRVALACAVSGLSAMTVRRLVADFEDTESIVLEDGVRGAAAEAYLRWARPPDGSKEKLREYFEEQLITSTTPVWITRRVVQQWFKDEYELEFSVNVVGKILKAWGFKYGKLQRPPRGENTAARRLQKMTYVLQLDAALKRGDILLFTDESYANVRLGFQYSYGPADSMFAAWVPKGKGLGQRLCIIHVLGYEGLLVSKNKDGSVYSPGLGAAFPEKPTAEMIFCATKDGSKGDYHGNFDAEVFLRWARTHLLPVLKSRYKDSVFKKGAKQMISIVVDNAKYHMRSTQCVYDGDGNEAELGDEDVFARFDPKNFARADLVTALKEHGCDSLKVLTRVSKKGVPDAFKNIIVQMDADEKDVKKGGNGKARLDELRAGATAWLAENKPSVLANDFEAMMAAACVPGGEGSRINVIWNAANFPEGNAIEKVWAGMKFYVAVKFNGKRNPKLLHEHLLEGMYTDEKADALNHVRGCSFVRDAKGECPTAAAIIDHVLYNPDGNGVAKVIQLEKDLNQGVKGVEVGELDLEEVPAELVALAEGAVNRKVLHHLLKKEMARVMGEAARDKVEEEADDLDDDDADEEEEEG
jgi:transposase